MTAALHNTTDAYEREAEETRRRLSNSLDELADNLTPGRMLDEVMTYAKGGGASFLKGLGNAASTNPIPSLLIAAGAAMFLSGKGRIDTSAPKPAAARANDGRDYAENGAGTNYPARSSRDDRPGVVSNALGAAGSVVSSAAHAIGSVASGAAKAVRSGVSTVGDAAGSAIGAVGDTAGSAVNAAGEGVTSTLSAVGNAATSAADLAAGAADTVLHGARDAGESIGKLAGSAGEAAKEGASFVHDSSIKLTHDLTDLTGDLTRRVGAFIREQPLLFAAAGLAIGVAAAAALPRTRMEDEIMGDTSDEVKQTLTNVATAEFEHGKEVVAHLGEELIDVAAAKGLSPGDAATAVRDLGEKVKSVVSTGAEKATAAVGELAGKTGGVSPGGRS